MPHRRVACWPAEHLGLVDHEVVMRRSALTPENRRKIIGPREFAKANSI